METWVPTEARRADRGAAVIEYAMLLALISVVCVVSLSILGTSVKDVIPRLDSPAGATPTSEVSTPSSEGSGTTVTTTAITMPAAPPTTSGSDGDGDGHGNGNNGNHNGAGNGNGNHNGHD